MTQRTPIDKCFSLCSFVLFHSLALCVSVSYGFAPLLPTRLILNVAKVLSSFHHKLIYTTSKNDTYAMEILCRLLSRLLFEWFHFPPCVCWFSLRWMFSCFAFMILSQFEWIIFLSFHSIEFNMDSFGFILHHNYYSYECLICMHQRKKRKDKRAKLHIWARMLDANKWARFRFIAN